MIFVLLLATAIALRLPAAVGVSHLTASSRHAAPRCQAADEPVVEIAEPVATAPEVPVAAEPAAPASGCEFCGATDLYGGCNGEGRCVTPWHRAGSWVVSMQVVVLLAQTDPVSVLSATQGDGWPGCD